MGEIAEEAIARMYDKRAALAWGGSFAAIGVIDYLAAKGEANGDTISECVRYFIPDTPAGHGFLAGIIATVAVWFYRHIVRKL